MCEREHARMKTARVAAARSRVRTSCPIGILGRGSPLGSRRGDDWGANPQFEWPVEANKNDTVGPVGEHGRIRTSQKVAPPATETTTHLYPCTIVPSYCRGARPIFVLRFIERAQGCPGSCEGIGHGMAHRPITCRRPKVALDNNYSKRRNEIAEFSHVLPNWQWPVSYLVASTMPPAEQP